MRSRSFEASKSAEYSLYSMSMRAPEDTGSFAYMVMFWQGVGQLFPWNAFITASSYFSERFCRTAMKSDYENYFSISFTAFQTIGLGISVLYGERFSLHDKIVYPLLSYSLLFGLTTALVLIENIDGKMLFWVTFSSQCVNGLSGAILSAGLFSLGGCLPQQYTSALMSGQGMAGLAVALAGILTQAAGPAPEGYCQDSSSDTDADSAAACAEYSISYSALSYFLIATIVLASCAALFYVLIKLPFTEYHIKLAGINAMSPSSELHEPLIYPDKVCSTTSVRGLAMSGVAGYATDDNSEMVVDSDYKKFNLNSAHFKMLSQSDDEDDDTFNSKHSSKTNPLIQQGENRFVSADSTEVSGSKLDTIRDAVSFKNSRVVTGNSDRDSNDGTLGSSMGISWQNIRRCLYKIKVPAFTVWLVFTVTISVFPSVIVFLTSEQHCSTTDRFYNDLFVPFFFVLFNLGDFLGRIFAGYYGMFFTANNVWIPGVLRIIFVPLFLLCNLQGSQLPVIFVNDIWPVLFMVLFSLSNGYVANCCMMLGPTLVENEDKPLAATIMIFCLTAGLMGGACFSFGATALSQGTGNLK